MFRKVIISHLGELTNDTRTAGDDITYRIYYDNPTEAKTNIVIIDALDRGLSNIRVFNGGRYDRTRHTITWTIKSLLPQRGAFVEFEATAGAPGVVSNEAVLSGLGAHPQKTDVVKTTVIAAPPVGWLPFGKEGKKGEPPHRTMKDETTMGLTVNFDIPGVSVHKKLVDGVAYQRFSIPGLGTLTDVGKPELPIVGAVLEVPFGVQFEPEIVKSASITLHGYNVYPAQQPENDQVKGVRPFEIDRHTYQTSALHPSALATVDAEEIAVVRGHRLIFLKVNPVQCNPVTRAVIAYSNIEVRLKYNHPAQINKVDRRKRSSSFEAMLKASVLNYKDPHRFGSDSDGGGGDKPTGCDYLIITADSLYNASDPNNAVVKLSNWKRRKGYRTRVTKVGSISGGNTAASIKAYLQDAYDHWDPAPTYVLLIGDADLVDTNDGSTHPDYTFPIGTDLYYATLDGSDYFPDVFIGRLSVQTTAQAGDVIDKIIGYEQNPPATPANSHFYADTTLVGLFTDLDYSNGVAQSTKDGQEGRPWIANLETIRTFLTGQNYTVDTVYVTDAGVPGNPGAQNPTKFYNGDSLPNDLLVPQYAWDGTAATITNAINGGRFLVTYRDHGAWDSWSNPLFDNNDVSGLNNNGLLPVVFSIACETGFFDNEKPGRTGWTANQECFCENMQRKAGSGSVAIVGATRITSTGWNDALLWGMHKAIWPAFVPSPSSNYVPASPVTLASPLLRMGQVLVYGDVYMAGSYGASDTRKRQFEMYHLFGDPEMPIWTQAPGDLKVEHPKAIGETGPQDFVVKVTNKANSQPLQDAMVVLTRKDNLIQTGQTDPAGIVRFTLNPVGSGDLDITVTAIQFRPYTGSIAVSAGGAVLTVDPTDGAEGQTINISGIDFSGTEQVDIYFGSQLIKTVSAQGGSFGAAPSTVDYTIPTPCAHGLVNVTARGQTSGRSAVDVFQVRDKNPVDLWTYCQWDSSTWGGAAGPVWNSPDIQLYDTNNNPVDSNNLTVGQQYTVKTKIHNNTSFQANQAKVTFRWENYGMGGPWNDFHVDTINVPAAGATAQASFTPPATGHLCLQAEVYHLEDTTPSNNVGQENLHVGPTSSPTKVNFIVWNPTDKPAAAYLEVRQMIKPAEQDKERLWATWIVHPDPQVLQPRGRGDASIVVDPDPADVKSGTSAVFAVTAFIGGRMIGGVNVVMTKKSE